MAATNGDPPAGGRLDSWKEISAYLKRGSRTLQRWEKNEGLPVHRHVHDAQASVYAFTAELDAWLAARSIAPASQIAPVPEPPSASAPAARPWRLSAAGIVAGIIAGIALSALGIAQWDHRRTQAAPATAPPPSTRPSDVVSGVPAPESQALPFHGRDWVLLGAFENHTGDPTLDRALSNVLSMELSNSSFLSVVPHQRVESALRLMRKPPDSKIDASLGREICLRDGNIHALITGAAQKTGASYLFTVEIVDPFKAQPVAMHSETAADKDQIWPAVRALSNWVRESLGEALSQIDQSNPPLDPVTTPSLKAVQLFTQADRYFEQGAPKLAAESLRLATAEDPNFASAHLLLAYVVLNNGVGTQSEGEQALARAMFLSASVGGRERALINAVHQYFTVSPDQALPAVEELERIYPDNYLGYATLVEMYTHLNRIDLACKAAARGADLNPNDYSANAFAARTLLPYDLARGSQYAARARMLAALEPDHPPLFLDADVIMSRFTEAWLRDDAATALAELRRIAQGPHADLLTTWIADDYLVLGRFRDAKLLYDQLRQPNEPSAAARLASYEGDENRAREQLVALMAEPGPSPFPYLQWEAHSQLPGWQKKYASIMETPGDGVKYTIDLYDHLGIHSYVSLKYNLRAESALAEGQASEAISLFQQCLDRAQGQGSLDVPLCARYLSETLEGTGDLKKAAQVLESVSKERIHPGDPGMEWLRNQARLARLYRKLGRVKDAQGVETQLRKLLAVADPGNPLLQELAAAAKGIPIAAAR